LWADWKVQALAPGYYDAQSRSCYPPEPSGSVAPNWRMGQPPNLASSAPTARRADTGGSAISSRDHTSARVRCARNDSHGGPVSFSAAAHSRPKRKGPHVGKARRTVPFELEEPGSVTEALALLDATDPAVSR